MDVEITYLPLARINLARHPANASLSANLCPTIASTHLLPLNYHILTTVTSRLVTRSSYVIQGNRAVHNLDAMRDAPPPASHPTFTHLPRNSSNILDRLPDSMKFDIKNCESNHGTFADIFESKLGSGISTTAHPPTSFS